MKNEMSNEDFIEKLKKSKFSINDYCILITRFEKAIKESDSVLGEMYRLLETKVVINYEINVPRNSIEGSL